jgi:hypothetical protein
MHPIDRRQAYSGTEALLVVLTDTSSVDTCVCIYATAGGGLDAAGNQNNPTTRAVPHISLDSSSRRRSTGGAGCVPARHRHSTPCCMHLMHSYTSQVLGGATCDLAWQDCTCDDHCPHHPSLFILTCTTSDDTPDDTSWPSSQGPPNLQRALPSCA